MDNLMRALNGVCEHCLPSVLSTTIQWYENHDKRVRFDKRQLAVHYLLCVVLIEILPQIHFFPEACEQSVSYIVTLAFKEVAYRDPGTVGLNYNNFLSVAERYAEVLGVLSQSHAPLIQRTFLTQLAELKKETPVTPATVNNIIALLMAMKFFRVKVFSSRCYYFYFDCVCHQLKVRSSAARGHSLFCPALNFARFWSI
uniref:MOR2-PAG1_N domain-containing protein n=1 Tax=Ascaris lumbricoides TaxID=6252 RepID=A0A0M3HEW4_ASCLU